eukprot:TRINITY_DN4191_c0_g2_i1.p1 TRINITY_DN4191_c0_g2~~TRINITY_DN4191_c0_g2_i1.p1  ORF type:complete len:354 (-),score=68.55 TRINITY_DN4191_c0_g2_i1:29-1090(-)
MESTQDYKVWSTGMKINSVSWYGYTGSSQSYGVLAAGSADEDLNQLSIWGYGKTDVGSEAKQLASARTDSSVTSIISLNNERFFVSTTYGNLDLWRANALNDYIDSQQATPLPSLTSIKKWKLHLGGIKSMDVLAADNDLLVTVGADNCLCLLKRGNLVKKAAGIESVFLNAVKFVNASSVATCGRSIKVWDVQSDFKKPGLSLSGNKIGGMIYSIAVHPVQPYYIASGDADGYLEIWDTRNYSWPIFKKIAQKGPIWDLSFHPSEPSILYSVSSNEALCWDFNVNKNINPEGFTTKEEDLLISKIVTVSHTHMNSVSVLPNINTLCIGNDEEQLIFNDAIYRKKKKKNVKKQ